MDQAGITIMQNSQCEIKKRRFGTKSLCVMLAAFAFLIAGCGTTTPPKKTAVSATPAPVPAGAVRVDRPVNVSFSTYSKEWPVGWQWIDPGDKENPTPKDVKKGVLRVTIPTGKDLYGENLTAPRYLKPITGDFQIETRVKFLPKENYQGAGLLIYASDDSYLRFERAYGGIGGGGEGLRLDVRNRESYAPLFTPNDLQLGLDEVDLKVVRTGRTFAAYWRENEDFAWREVGQYESEFPETVLAGLAAYNTAREISAEFAYIRLLPNVGP